MWNWSKKPLRATCKSCLFTFSEGKKTKEQLLSSIWKDKGQFILQYLHEQAEKPVITSKRLELMCIHVRNVRTVNSTNFIPIALAALPKCFAERKSIRDIFHIYSTKSKAWTIQAHIPMPFFMDPLEWKQMQRTNSTSGKNKQVSVYRYISFFHSFLKLYIVIIILQSARFSISNKTY